MDSSGDLSTREAGASPVPPLCLCTSKSVGSGTKFAVSPTFISSQRKFRRRSPALLRRTCCRCAASGADILGDLAIDPSGGRCCTLVNIAFIGNGLGSMKQLALNVHLLYCEGLYNLTPVLALRLRSGSMESSSQFVQATCNRWRTHNGSRVPASTTDGTRHRAGPICDASLTQSLMAAATASTAVRTASFPSLGIARPTLPALPDPAPLGQAKVKRGRERERERERASRMLTACWSQGAPSAPLRSAPYTRSTPPWPP